MNTVNISASVSINKGKVRANNEDNFYFGGKYLDEKTRDVSKTYENNELKDVGIYGVFDGMGGEALGEVASLITAEAIKKAHLKILSGHTVERNILSAIENANIKICKKMKESGEKRIGTTFAAVTICEDTAKVYNVGDSRVYLMRDGHLKQLSIDDTTAQRLVNLGMITKENAKTHDDRHKLTQHLGIFPNELTIEPHISTEVKLKKGDKLLLCSDGLTDMVDDERIEALLKESDDSKEITEILVKEALANGGKDNVTAMVICVKTNSKIKASRKSKNTLSLIIAIMALCLCGVIFAIVFSGKQEVQPTLPQDTVAERVYFAGIDEDVIRIPVGKEDYLRCGAEPIGVNMKKAVFSSSDNMILEVDKYGHYKALSSGNVEAYVDLDDCRATQKIYIYTPVADIILPTSLDVPAGGSVKIDYDITPNDAEYDDIVFSTPDDNIIMVDKKGTVKGIKPGIASVAVSAGDIEKEIKINVIDGTKKKIMDKSNKSDSKEPAKKNDDTSENSAGTPASNNADAPQSQNELVSDSASTSYTEKNSNNVE